MIRYKTNSRSKPHGPPLATPRTEAQVRGYAKRKVLWRLWPFQRSAAREAIRQALSELTDKYPYPNQVLVYEREKTDLENLLDQLTDVD